ncbi:MAG: type II secretion system protein [Candidatus Riflebacteria bacterium]|nr:type II secretion system protein [Candidatus Riflebacteria bacterium]
MIFHNLLNNRRSGLFLLEVLAAVLILGVTVASTVNSLSSSMHSIQYSKNINQSLVLCENLIENLRYCWATDPTTYNAPDPLKTWVSVSAAPPAQKNHYRNALQPIINTNFDMRYRISLFSDPSVSFTPAIVAGHPLWAARNQIYYVEASVAPLDQVQGEGATLTTFLSLRGP